VLLQAAVMLKLQKDKVIGKIAVLNPQCENAPPNRLPWHQQKTRPISSKFFGHT
jgi:hypothetical protein